MARKYKKTNRKAYGTQKLSKALTAVGTGGWRGGGVARVLIYINKQHIFCAIMHTQEAWYKKVNTQRVVKLGGHLLVVSQEV